MSESRTYEMQWDCQFCGTTKLLGKTHRHCPNCGAPQDPNSRYYPSDDEKVAVEDHVFVGADKVCDSCNALNSGNSEFCGNCGAPLTAAALAKTVEAQTKAQGGMFEAMASRDVVKEKFDAEMERAGVKGKDGGVDKRLIAVIAVIAVIIVGVIFALTATKETNVVASGHSWEREILIDEYQAVREGTWQRSVPGSAYSRSCYEKQSGTNRIPDGQDCHTVRVDRGDGTFSESEQCTTRYREEPVYDTWCDYTIDKWTYERSVKTNGNSLDDTPTWGEASLNCASQTRLGCEREAERKESYLVHFRASEGENQYQCPFPQAEWEQVRVESIWKVDVRRLDANAADCNSLEPAAQ